MMKFILDWENVYSKEEKWISAIAAYEKAISIEDLKEEYYTGLGNCYFQINELDAAKYYFQKATEMAPEISNCWIQYTLFLLETNTVDKALAVIEEGLFYSYGTAISFCKAACLFAANQRQEALRFLNTTLAENDFKPEEIFTFFTRI